LYGKLFHDKTIRKEAPMASGKVLKWLAMTGILALLAGCAKGEKGKPGGGEPAGSSGSGELVAKVGEVSISLNDFEEQINQQNPLVRSRYKSVDQKKKLLDSLVEREAMVLEAKRMGLDKDQEVIQGYKKILARHLVNMEFNQKRVKEIEISDEVIDKYYNENIDRYRAPDKVRIHQIFLAAPASDKKKRKEAQQKAADLLKQLKDKDKQQDRRVFLQLARQHSDDEATKRVGGDTNFKTRAQLEETYGKAFADAAFALKQANDVSGVIPDPKGFYILRLSGKQAAIDLPLERVKGQIRTTLFARARGEAYRAFVEEVKNKVGVQVFEDAVENAKVDLTQAPTDAPPGPFRQPPGPGRPMISPAKRPPGAPAPRVVVPPSGAGKPAPGK
jgi:peptidyl-prolyl cis-trans isomerase C